MTKKLSPQEIAEMSEDCQCSCKELEQLRDQLRVACIQRDNAADEIERLQSNQREHIQEITELTQSRDDYKADYLRMHKMFMDLKYPDTVPAHEPLPCAPRESDWCCTHCGRDNDPSETHCVHCEWSRKHTVAGVLHERGCEDNPCRCGALKSQGASRDASPPYHVDATGTTREPPHCPTCDCGTPADLVGALQDVVHTDPGPVRAAHAVRDASSDGTCPVCGFPKGHCHIGCTAPPPAPPGVHYHTFKYIGNSPQSGNQMYQCETCGYRILETNAQRTGEQL